VRREDDRAVEHPRSFEVRDVGPSAEHGFDPFVAHERRADAARGRDLRHLTGAFRPREEFDRVDDLDVPRATAQVPVDRRRDLLARGVLILVDQVLCPQRDPRDAEAALQARRRDESARKLLALALVESLEGRDLLAVALRRRCRARHFRRAIDDREAATALSLRLAPVLQRLRPAPSAQRIEQGLVALDLERALRTVDDEVDRGHGRGS
jgi:hypothetical protein